MSVCYVSKIAYNIIANLTRKPKVVDQKLVPTCGHYRRKTYGIRHLLQTQ